MSTLHPIEAFTVPSDAVFQSGCRLEGSFYGSDGYRAARALFRSGFDLENVGEHANVFNPPIFKRAYVDDEQSGVPYLTGSALLEARPIKENFLSRTLTSCLDELSVREGMVLISDSGSIGRTVLATRDIDGWASTNNLIRVLSNDRETFSQEFFYTYFVTSVGEYLLTRNTYGSVVEHIEPAHVKQTPFPVLPKLLREKLTEMIQDVSRLRVEANRLLTLADAEVQRQCDLPRIEDFRNGMYRASLSKPSVFAVGSSNVMGAKNAFGAIRLDATYYLPLATELRNFILNNGGKDLISVVSTVRRSAMRQRVYVEEPSQGVPLIGGKQMMQIRPSDVNYISKLLTRGIERERVRRGWTLVTCSGTLGRVQFVHRNFEEFIPSEHCMRIVPNEAEAKAGFIYAFLASPYGQIQLAQRSYGSVIPELRDFQFHSIAIALPADRGESISDIVVSAFECRADALAVENDAIRLFQTAIEDGKKTTEAKWGREY